MFNDGVTDGLNLYLLSDKTKKNVYGENKVKYYQPPIRLVTQARLTPIQGEQDVETVKGNAQFTVPLKELMLKNIEVTTPALAEIRRGVIEFHGTFYNIDNILPKAYVEDVFLLYTFVCTEDLQVKSVAVYEEPPEEGDENESESDNDGGLE